jgi:hypothetical protein
VRQQEGADEYGDEERDADHDDPVEEGAGARRKPTRLVVG